MEFRIRPLKASDAPFTNEIRIMEGVMENILGIPSERIASSEKFFAALGNDDHVFVAECMDNEPKIIGVSGLHVRSGRRRHSAGVGIMVHREYQGQGVGRALMQKVLDVADNWLMLVRVDLEVFADNERAIKLYESLGFEKEGVIRCASIRNGVCADEYLMSRIRK